LKVNRLGLGAAAFQALVEATWPALTSLSAVGNRLDCDGPPALGAAAFAGFPALEELDLTAVKLGEAGARLLASRRWARLRRLVLVRAQLDVAAVAALARGAWPALRRLDLRGNRPSGPLTLEEARLWAPSLLSLADDAA
jgi:hypothetical protein